MGLPVVIVANGGLAVREATNAFGIPMTEAVNGRGLAVTFVTNGGLPVVGISAGGGGGGSSGPIGLLFLMMGAR